MKKVIRISAPLIVVPPLIFGCFLKLYGIAIFNKCCRSHVQHNYTKGYNQKNQTIGNEHKTKITTKTIVKSFLPKDKPETSSKGPGCLNMDMKNTKNAIGQKPSTINSKIDRKVKTLLVLSPTRDLAT
ncbi:MAG: hypothetical protein QXH37_06345 [Candidatus Bathyarchaeia archaeon]